MQNCMYIMVFALLLSNCNSPSKQAADVDKNSVRIAKKPFDEDSLVDTFRTLYHFANDTLTQNLYIQQINSKTISFLYQVLNNASEKKVRIYGVARWSGDVEVDNDDEGNGYPVRLYRCKKGVCEIEIRLPTESDTIAQTISFHCEDANENNACPLTSVGILKKVR
jgi:hypothetical protein